jgi:hypothetical protein
LTKTGETAKILRMTERLNSTFFKQYDLQKSYEIEIKQSSKFSFNAPSFFSFQIPHLEQREPFNLSLLQALKI